MCSFSISEDKWNINLNSVCVDTLIFHFKEHDHCQVHLFMLFKIKNTHWKTNVLSLVNFILTRRFLRLLRLRAFVSSAAVIAFGISCLFAKTKMTASLSSSSFNYKRKIRFFKLHYFHYHDHHEAWNCEFKVMFLFRFLRKITD